MWSSHRELDREQHGEKQQRGALCKIQVNAQGAAASRAEGGKPND
jgi:hypothetical protein